MDVAKPLLLKVFFPKLQFIITTHSPHLIASAYAGEIIKILYENSAIDIKPNDKVYSGWSTDEILEDVMEVKNLENKLYSVALKNAMDYITQNDIEGVKKSIEQLDSIVHPNNTIVNEIKIKLAEMILGE